jgi:hypothetical protein
MKSFGFDEKIKTNGFKKFKGEKGKKYIGALVPLSGPDAQDFFKGSATHYHEGSQKRFLCLSDEDKGIKEHCCTSDYAGSDPVWRIGAVLVLYRVADDNSNKIVGIADVIPWIFNPTIFTTLKTIFADHGHVDMSFECQDSTYQKFVILPKKGVMWKNDEKSKSYVMAQAKKQFENLPKQIATKMSLGEIREILGGGISSAEDAASSLDLGSISSSLSG